jgi:hypothetical protein
MTHTRGSTAEPSNPSEGGTDSTGEPLLALPDHPTVIPGDELPALPAFDPRLLPVLAYDVVTTPADTDTPTPVPFEPRLVVSVRESREAHALAGRLNAMRAAGLLISLSRYTVALPREISRDVPPDPADPVIVDGYTLSPSAFAERDPVPGEPKE